MQATARLITTGEAAKILAVTPGRIRQLIDLQELRSEKHGRDHLLELGAVEKYNREGRRKGGRPRKEGKHLRVR